MIRTGTCLAASLLAISTGCGKSGKGLDCSSAMETFHDQGCTYESLDHDAALAACRDLGSQARDAGCGRQFDAWLECLSGVTVDCSACDDVLAVLEACLSASGTPCEGYSGPDTGCCRLDDPCGWRDNGSCDCDEKCGWDSADCGIPVVSGMVDVLVVVDNSMSMAQEQANLAGTFPALIGELLDPPDTDGDTVPDHVPVDDLHIGVISTDMGTGNYVLETCRDPVDGDDGALLHEPNPGIAGCEDSYPSYLSYACEDPSCPDIDSIDSVSTGFRCIATLGTEGCGFEQQMKAARRALIDQTVVGGPNEGFARQASVLVVVFLTDEEDCSVAPGNERFFDPLDTTLGELSLRCWNHPLMLVDVEAYVGEIRSLRFDPGRLLFAFIVGVPPGPICEGLGDEIPDCLDHPDMQEEVDPSNPTRLLPSCDTSLGLAYPPRRFVEMAQLLGDAALVGSICRPDLGPAIRTLTERIHAATDD